MDFEQLLKPCYEGAIRFARSIAGSRLDGDDLIQDAFVKAWRGFPKLKNPDFFKSWLFRIIINQYRSSKRKSWVKRMVGLESAELVQHADAFPFEENEMMRLALKGVPLIQRETLVLFEVINMTIAEIAAYHQVSESTVKSRLMRGGNALAAVTNGRISIGVQNMSDEQIEAVIASQLVSRGVQVRNVDVQSQQLGDGERRIEIRVEAECEEGEEVECEMDIQTGGAEGQRNERRIVIQEECEEEEQ